MTITSRKRISYVLQPPTYPVPLLCLPTPSASSERLGKTRPLLVCSPTSSRKCDQGEGKLTHPRHRLGVSCLALDTSTILEGKTSPEGILYSGGRDGMLVSWDLKLNMRKRIKRRATDSQCDGDGEGGGAARVRNRWEYATGWADELCVSDEEEPAGVSQAVDGAGNNSISGDILGDVTLPATIRRKRILERLAMTPYENQWELDVEYGDSFNSPSTSPSGTTFRQCAQAHEDWVNDLLLCNYNQTVASASSDGTVKAWNPHSSSPTSSSSPSLGEPSIIGLHADYVRCITHSREQRWVASGSFDRTIKLWDLSISLSTTTRGKLEPLTTLSLPDNHHHTISPLSTTNTSTSPHSTSHSHSHSYSHSHSNSNSDTHTHSSSHSSSNTKSSIYALATDPFGHIIASGSPERVVRLWDPRTGKRTGKLVGHTDNIRAILVSDDCRYLLTGSADASIKLWSLVSQRCLHTFTHHTDSVWSLHSTHPSLLTFYSGDKSGMVCKLDVEAWCERVSDGECFLVCHDGGGESAQGGGGITKIVSLDDHFIWTASGRSSINRWRVPIPRDVRVAKYRKEKDIASIVGSITAQSHPSPRPSRPSSISFDVPDSVPVSPSHGDHYEQHGRHSNTPTTHFGIPTESLIRLTSPNDPFALTNSYRPGSRLGGPGSSIRTGRVGGIGRLGTGGRTGRLGGGVGGEARSGIPGGSGSGHHHLDAADVATLYSAASFLSIPRALTMAGIGPLNRTMFPGQYHHDHNAQSGKSPGEEFEGVEGEGEREAPTLFASHSFSSLKPPSSYLPAMTPTSDSQDNHENEYGARDLHIHTDLSDLHHDPHDPCSDMHDILADLPILASDAVPYSKDPDHIIQGDTGLVRALVLNDKMHVLTVDTKWEIAVWDIVRGVCVGRFEGHGCGGDGCHEKEEEKDGKDKSYSNEGEESGKDKEVTEAKSPREALEAVRERIEGQGVTPKWASVDAKTGVLVVHLNERCFEAEVYGDEVGYGSEEGGSEELKINLGKWVLRNLFIGFLREERKIRKDQLPSITNATITGSTNVPSPTIESGSTNQTRSTTVVICSATMIPSLPPSVPLLLDASEPPLMTPLVSLIPIQPQADDDDTDLATVIETSKQSRPRPRIRAISSKGSAGSGGGRGRPQVNVNVNVNVGSPGTPLVSSATTEHVSTPKQKTSMTPVDDFSGWSGPGSARPANTANNNTINTSNVTTNVSNATPSTPEGMRPTTPNTGLMNKLRSFGEKISAIGKPTMSEMVPALPSATTSMANSATTTTVVSTPTTATGGTDNRKNLSEDHKDPEKTAVQQILSGPLSPPPSTEAPHAVFPPNTLVMISEESSPHHLNVYRGTVGNTHNDVKVLEQVVPAWLLAYLLQNKILSQSNPAKISFVLLPWTSKDPEEEALPELLNTAQSKLTASRYLRVRKLVNHIHEKLDKVVSGRLSPSKSSSSSPTSLVFTPTTALASSDDHSYSKSKPRAEDVYEILCNGVLLPLDMTLGAVRQYVWKSSSELTMWYRLRNAAKRKYISETDGRNMGFAF